MGRCDKKKKRSRRKKKFKIVGLYKMDPLSRTLEKKGY